MPIADPKQRVHLYPFPIGDAIADFWCEHSFGHFRFDGLRHVVYGKSPVVRELHPNEIKWHDHAVVTDFHVTHRTDVQIIEDIAKSCVYRGVMVENSRGPMHAGEPNIWSNVDMQAIVSVCLLRLRRCNTCPRLSLSM